LGVAVELGSTGRLGAPALASVVSAFSLFHGMDHLAHDILGNDWQPDTPNAAMTTTAHMASLARIAVSPFRRGPQGRQPAKPSAGSGVLLPEDR
jgi:hypothetical protein